MAAIGRAELAAVEVAAALPRCRDCRWWKYEESQGVRVGEYQQWGECDLVVPGHQRLREGERALAIAFNALVTSPDFGCVQWQAKDA